MPTNIPERMTNEEMNKLLKERGVPRPSLTTPTADRTRETPKSSFGMMDFLNGVGSTLGRAAEFVYEKGKERVGQIGETLERGFTGKQTPVETGLQTVGAAAGFVGDIAGGAIEKAVETVVPENIRETVGGVVKTAAEAVGVPEMMEKYQTWKKENPQAAANLESAVNIASLFPVPPAARVAGRLAKTVEEGAEVVAKKAIPAIGEVAGGAAGVVEKRLGRQALDEALELTKPKLTAREQAEAIATPGRLKEGAFGKKEILPGAEDIRVAESVKDVIKKGAKPSENIGAISNEIETISKQVESRLLADKRGFNEQTLRARLGEAKDKSRVIFGSDKTLESAYDSVIDEMVRVINTKPKHLAGLWDARKEFDRIINEKFPNLLSGEARDSVRNNAVKDVRRTLNNFIAEQAPEAEFSQNLRRMSDMFEARDRIAANVRETIGKGMIERIETAIRKSPIMSIGITGGITIGGMMGLLTNPFAIGAIVAYGGFRTAKGLITGRQMKEAIVKILRGVERGTVKLRNSDAAQLKTLINQLPDEPIPKASAGAAPLKSATDENEIRRVFTLAPDAKKYIDTQAEKIVRAVPNTLN